MVTMRWTRRAVLTAGFLGSAALADPPDAGVRFGAGSLTVVSSWTEIGEDWLHVNSGAQPFTLTATEVADGWRLVVENDSTTETISQIYWPWGEDTALPGDGGGGDQHNFALGPYQAGSARLVIERPSGLFNGVPYTGGAFAPILIVADESHAKAVFASNWPPRALYPNIVPFGAYLQYVDVGIAPSGTDTFYCDIVSVTGSDTNGDPPWYKAALQYRSWLRGKMTAEGLYPVSYPDWMVENQGFFAPQLYARYNPSSISNPLLQSPLSDVSDHWYDMRSDLSMVLFWGQMSAAAGPCCAGSCPTDPNSCGEGMEPTKPWASCVADCDMAGPRNMHCRYKDPNAFYDDDAEEAVNLPDWVDSILSGPYHVGFYTRPEAWTGTGGCRTGPLTNGEQTWLQQWINRVTGGGALDGNALYVDTLGAYPYLSPLEMASRFDPNCSAALCFPEGTVIEGIVDVYPTAFLLSGFLGIDLSTGGPDHTLEAIREWSEDPNFCDDPNLNPTVPFPDFATVVCNDRVLYNGQLNISGSYWGAAADYWVERSVFLLGHKLSISNHWNPGGAVNGENKIYRLTLDLRKNHDWWERSSADRGMRYKYTRDITDVHGDLRVRRFTATGDTPSSEVFAVEWWDVDPNDLPDPNAWPSFEYDGTTYYPPPMQLSIIDDVCDLTTAAAADVNADGVVDATDRDLVDDATNAANYPYISRYDLDCDSDVDADDVCIVIEAMSEMCP